MSTMNPLPPQAYTKDILVQAYAWLQSQSEHIKELATTPDVLVSLYLKAKLQGDGALERPSIQNFKNELRNLAGMIGEFEVLESPATVTSQGPNQTIRIRSQDLRSSETPTTAKASSNPLPQSSAPTSRSAPSAESGAPPASPHPGAGGPSFSHSASQQAAQPSGATSALPGLDSRSLDMIQEVKFQFNLSSDSEAQRLLLAIGYNQVRGLLK